MPVPPRNIRRRTGSKGAALLQARLSLRNRLEQLRPEMERALELRLNAIGASTHPVYQGPTERPAATLSAAVDYMLMAVAYGEKKAVEIPLDLLVQARKAARNSVPLDTVLRECFAGYAVLADYVFREAQADGTIRAAAHRQLLQGQSALFDRFIEAMTEEYRFEAGTQQSSEQHFADRIKRLLAGEMLDTSSIEYNLDGHHVAGIGVGNDAFQAAQVLARQLNRRLLAVQCEERVWVWFGGNDSMKVSELVDLAAETLDPDISFTFGETASGLNGWRRSHLQAKAAMPVSEYLRSPGIRYGDVALVASILSNRLLSDSLMELFLSPLASERDGGQTARDTLNAYFAADRNISSAAAQLGVKRHTVTRRLRAIEQLLGRSLTDCATELELALEIGRMRRIDRAEGAHTGLSWP